MTLPSKFINREPELDFLNENFHQKKSSLVIIYGRRRIGKTTLINQFISGKNSLYFMATEESERENKKSIQHLLSEFLSNPLLKKNLVLEWHEIFSLFAGHAPDVRKILVIDEFQYLGKINKAFPSIFQKIWDEILVNANVMVILCGSLVSMMVHQTLSYSSPLYGRRTGQIRMTQIAFKNYRLFFDETENHDLIAYYSVTGGVPKYIELFKPMPDIFEAIKTNILSKQCFLYEEPIFLLEREVGEIGTYFSIIKSIAAGHHKIGKIAANIGINQSGATKYLRTLMELDILERITPVTETNPEKSKNGLYIIKDNFIRFWFRFVYPYRHYLEMENMDVVIHKIRQNFNDNHVSYIYEDICRERLSEMIRRDLPDFILSKAGRWWDKNTEIDILALDSKEDAVLFGECKYSSRKIDPSVYYRLKEKSKKVPCKNDTQKWYVLFSKSGFNRELIDLAKKEKGLVLYHFNG